MHRIMCYTVVSGEQWSVLVSHAFVFLLVGV